MFVERETSTLITEKNGVALRQRRGGRETLVQWSNGRQRWTATDELKGEIRLVDHGERGGYSYE